MLKLSLDNDVLMKVIQYRLGNVLFEHCLIEEGRHTVGILGTARWVCEARLQTLVERGDGAPEIIDDLRALIATAEHLEPTDDELELAARLETMAADIRLPLDTGESQLAAIAASRGGLLVTGDKRAISALENLSETWTPEMDALLGNVASFEHVVMTLLLHVGTSQVRAAVYTAPKADTAMRLAFSSGDGRVDSPPLGLLSYLRAVERSAPSLCTEAQSLCWEPFVTPN